jgi:hypothetical protein
LYLALSKNSGKNNTTNDKFVVKATYIERADLPCSLMRRLGLHFTLHLSLQAYEIDQKSSRDRPVGRDRRVGKA